MPLNVLGPDDAIDALAHDVEEQRAKDPSYPWSFAVSDRDGPILNDDREAFSRGHDPQLIELSKRHPEVVFVTGEVDCDDNTGVLINADLFRYAKGRRRTVASVRCGSPGWRDQISTMFKAALRYDRRPERA